MEPDRHKYLFKYIIVGSSSVGKSCLLRQFAESRFETNYNMTIGVEFGSRVGTVNDTAVKLQIWDTAGQESFRSITRSYYRGAVGALVVFDLTHRKTFEDVASWYTDCKEQCKTDVTVLLIGNKADLTTQREVSTEEATEFANQHGIDYFETSAKTSQNVDAAFWGVAKKILQKIDDGRIDVATLGGSNRSNPSSSGGGSSGGGSKAAAGGGGGGGGASSSKSRSVNPGQSLEPGKKEGDDKKCCGKS